MCILAVLLDRELFMRGPSYANKNKPLLCNFQSVQSAEEVFGIKNHELLDDQVRAAEAIIS